VYADMVAGLRARYAMPKFVALEKYQNLQRAHNEPLCSFAQKLRSLHNRFTGLPIAEEAAREPLLKHVLLSRILSTLTTSVRAQAQVLFESNPDMALEVFLSRVDGFCSYSQSGSSGSQSASRFHKSMSQNRQQQRSQWCDFHKSTTHSNQECSRNQQGSTQTSTPASSSSTRFRAPGRSQQAAQTRSRVCAAIEEPKLNSDSENEG
jgi:hypothetical protein